MDTVMKLVLAIICIAVPTIIVISTDKKNEKPLKDHLAKHLFI
jgi:hypothetical protein